LLANKEVYTFCIHKVIILVIFMYTKLI